MKNTIVIFCCLVLAMAVFSGCGNNSSINNNISANISKPSSTSPTTTSAPTTTTETTTTEPAKAGAAYGFDNIDTVYKEGQYKVGTDMPSDEYMIFANNSGGYFCVSADSNKNDIIFNGTFDLNSIITVYDGEYVELSRCIAIPTSEFYTYYSIDPSAIQGEGAMLLVGTDIEPGEYKLITESSSSGYYCIYSNSRHDDIIANNVFDNSCYVTVEYGQYFKLERCHIE